MIAVPGNMPCFGIGTVWHLWMLHAWRGAGSPGTFWFREDVFADDIGRTAGEVNCCLTEPLKRFCKGQITRYIISRCLDYKRDAKAHHHFFL